MTKAEFISAKHRFQREITWTVMAWFVLWIVVVFAIGAGCRYWFHDHPVVSAVFISLAVVVFLALVYFISKLLHRKHRMICPSCGNWMLMGSAEGTDKCPRCRAEIFHDV